MEIPLDFLGLLFIFAGWVTNTIISVRNGYAKTNPLSTTFFAIATIIVAINSFRSERIYLMVFSFMTAALAVINWWYIPYKHKILLLRGSSKIIK